MNEERCDRAQPITNEYNALRTEEYQHIRSRFFKLFPIDHNKDGKDGTFEDDLFGKFEQLQAENKRLKERIETYENRPAAITCPKCSAIIKNV